jgi:hypothetical protein
MVLVRGSSTYAVGCAVVRPSAPFFAIRRGFFAATFRTDFFTGLVTRAMPRPSFFPFTFEVPRATRFVVFMAAPIPCERKSIHRISSSAT